MGQLAGAEVIEVAASALDVWSYRLDFTNLPEYNPQVSGVSRVREGEGAGGALGPGATYEFSLTVGATAYPVSLTVTEANEGVSIAADMTGRSTAYESFELETLGPQRCRVTLSLYLELPEGLDETTVERALARGRADIRGELDLIADVFERRADR